MAVPWLLCPVDHDHHQYTCQCDSFGGDAKQMTVACSAYGGLPTMQMRPGAGHYTTADNGGECYAEYLNDICLSGECEDLASCKCGKQRQQPAACQCPQHGTTAALATNATTRSATARASRRPEQQERLSASSA